MFDLYHAAFPLPRYEVRNLQDRLKPSLGRPHPSAPPPGNAGYSSKAIFEEIRLASLPNASWSLAEGCSYNDYQKTGEVARKLCFDESDFSCPGSPH
jgi:hypothetical protein